MIQKRVTCKLLRFLKSVETEYHSTQTTKGAQAYAFIHEISTP